MEAIAGVFLCSLLGVPIAFLILAYESYCEQRRNDEYHTHRIEMERMDKLLEMHKAGMNVTDGDGPPAASPEPPKEVVSESKPPE